MRKPSYVYDVRVNILDQREEDKRHISATKYLCNLNEWKQSRATEMDVWKTIKWKKKNVQGSWNEQAASASDPTSEENVTVTCVKSH